MKLDVSEYERQVEVLEMKLKSKSTLIDRQLSAKSLPIFYE